MTPSFLCVKIAKKRGREMEGKIIKPDVPYQNKILLNGQISKSVCVGGSRMATFYLKTKRFSSYEDEFHVYLPAENIKGLNLRTGCFVSVDGEIRTRNVFVGDERRLQVSVYANKIENLSEEFAKKDDFVRKSNNAYLGGAICKMYPLRTTPRGKTLQEGMIAINNREIGQSYYIPFIAWDKAASFINRTYRISDQVSLHGRFQSREYEKKQTDGSLNTRTAYEVSVIRMDPIIKDF